MHMILTPLCIKLPKIIIKKFVHAQVLEPERARVGYVSGTRCIPLLHTDVSVRACTSFRPFVITSKSCWILLLSTVSYRKYLF